MAESKVVNRKRPTSILEWTLVAVIPACRDVSGKLLIDDDKSGTLFRAHQQEQGTIGIGFDQFVKLRNF